MNKYNVILSYSGDISVDVEAESETDAEENAVKKVAEMDNKEYIENMNPECVEARVEKKGI